MLCSVFSDGNRDSVCACSELPIHWEKREALSFGIRCLLILALLLLLGGCAGKLGSYHTVKKGETLYSISRDYDVPVQKIAQVNALRNPDVIYPGERLYIPGVRKAGATASTASVASVKPASSSSGSKGHMAISGALPPPTKSRPFAWPARGLVVSRFGVRHGRMHNGIDIAADEGKPVYAARSGKVIFVSDYQKGYGRLILIQHDETYITVYAHNSKNLVRLGDKVKQGQTIALIGRTGNATGPHLHFEIRQNRKPIDPLKLLSKPGR